MKILFIANNYEHPNKMHIESVRGFINVCEFDFFGPGYCTEKELEAGLKTYWKEKGGYDALILDFTLAFLHSEYLDIRNAYDWHRYTIASYSIFDAIRYADKIVEDAMEIDAVKMLWYHCDTINISEKWKQCVQALLDRDFYLLGLGSDFCPEIEESEHMKWGNYSNRYRKLTIHNEKRVISVPFCTVSISDFYFCPLERREYNVVVPGSLNQYLYPQRSIVLQKMMESEFSVYNDYYDRELAYRNGNSRTENSLYKCEEDKCVDRQLKYKCPYLDARLFRDSIIMWRENYNASLMSSQIGYADGGLSQQIFQKYLEIPAKGTMLISADIPPLGKFGFKEWENIVIVTPETVVDICSELFRNPEKMQRIADAGTKMILEKHAAEVHAKYVLKGIDAISKGQFNGSLWENGEFVILK